MNAAATNACILAFYSLDSDTYRETLERTYAPGYISLKPHFYINDQFTVLYLGTA